MLLITEQNFENLDVLTEKNDESGEKKLYIEGIFLQSNIKNRNGRIYEDRILKPVVDKYINEQITTGRAVGELQHPDSPSINLDRVSHRITEMKWDRDDVYGKALILNTPTGNIAKGLLEGGTKLGVSSRGMGTLEKRNGSNYVKDDFQMVCIDIVADPSAPSAFVNGILEGVEFRYDSKGGIIAQQIQNEIDEEEIVIEKKQKHIITHLDEALYLKRLAAFLHGQM